MCTVKRLLVLDLDGTALGGFVPYDRLPRHFCIFLDELVAAGWAWALNTTWDPEGQWKMVNDSPVNSRPEFLIGEYGRVLVQVRGSELCRVEPYCREQERKLSDVCARKLTPLLAALCGEFAPSRVYYYGHLLHYILAAGTDMEKFLEFCISYLQDPELIGQVKNNSLAIRPRFLHKGLPMPWLKHEFGYQPENIVVAGDNVPDMDMMNRELAGHFICPGNAVEEVKKHIKAHNGAVGKSDFAAGVIEAFLELRLKGFLA